MRYCLADFFLLQKKKEITAGLIRENKIAGIACRVAASSNKAFHWIAGVSAALKSFDLATIIITNKFTGNPCNQ